MKAIKTARCSPDSSGAGACLGKRVLLALLLLATCFQNYIAQTHVHGSSATAVRAATSVQAGSAQASAHSSISSTESDLAIPADDHAGCLLCQAVAHTGAALVATVLGLLLPLSRSDAVRLPRAQLHPGVSLDYDSRQRGPPALS
jgi:hypothetical protein